MKKGFGSYQNKAVFLDRDGVINRERGEYTFKIEDFEIMPGVIEGLKKLKGFNYKLIIITNQAGISRGLYTREEMNSCHQFFNDQAQGIIDAIYYCPWHPTKSRSIARKPEKLMFERAIHQYEIDPSKSYMIGDKDRDLLPAKKLGITTCGITNEFDYADIVVGNFEQFVEKILKS
ncbi:D-glycero-alpha-D-manno-heptose-1,7-bisphosphate 7-phosphatase [Marinigracilibium pacificum]|uniref:D,D-heptose 1,7-bisphosphate phosphatase n=1 Tax=Marinigracilibium pacificum TaxID=2729599 RepID=A0A848J760_9BACT|nr:HAD family hydrolase [Marinigracilibium pacificum]NMM50229.1 HAD family hydrolase [Marinigracilibium pacificum]